MELAMTNIKNNTYDPYEAVIMALETWLNKKGFMLVPILPKGKDSV